MSNVKKTSRLVSSHAGIMAQHDAPTGDGYEQQMQTNHLSHFLLTSLLMPCLETAAAKRGNARVVTHSSAAYKGPKTALKEMYLRKGAAFGGDGMPARFERYHQSKLANVLFTLQLQVCMAASAGSARKCRATCALCVRDLHVGIANAGSTAVWEVQ